MIVVINFVADIIYFILEVIFIRDLYADRGKNNSDVVFRFGFCQQCRVRPLHRYALQPRY